MSSAMVDNSFETPIVVTDFDRHRLEALIQLFRSRGGSDEARLDALEDELARAEVVARYAIGPDVVTMNSTVNVLDLDSREMRTLTVVFPGTADPDASKVSVLAPLGLALFGARAGDEIAWKTPGRRRRMRVESVPFQPEAAGIFTL